MLEIAQVLEEITKKIQSLNITSTSTPEEIQAFHIEIARCEAKIEAYGHIIEIIAREQNKRDNGYN